MRVLVPLLSLVLLRPAACMVVKATGGGTGKVKGQETLEASSGPSGSSGPIGFASLNGGTTGGAAGQTVTVSTASAFRAAVQDNIPRVIRLTTFLRNLGAIFVGSNKSILGVSSKRGPAGFVNSSLVLTDVKNVIIRNLKMQLCQGADNDCVTINGGSRNVWVDHNDFSSSMLADKDKYDGLTDVTQASSFVTISNNVFHDHHKCMLLGADDSERRDRAIRVTVHNNYFYKVGSRLPSVRFGRAHVFNNVYHNVTNSAVSARMGAQLLIEGNVFIQAQDPVMDDQSRQPGFCVMRDNIFIGRWQPRCGPGTFNKAPYPVKVSPASAVQVLVLKDSGVGVIKT